MKEHCITADDGTEFQVLSDGRTVWVNHPQGYMVGRFSSKGLEVRGAPYTDSLCLTHRIGSLPYQPLARKEEWEIFAVSMKKHYGVEMREGLVEFLPTDPRVEKEA